jgi:dienelactone hydrolase
MKKRYKIFIVVCLAVVIVLSGFVIWAETPSVPMEEAYNALQSDALVSVSQGQWLVFQPNNNNYTTGLIFYPGGRVNYLSYAPYAHAIAAEGYLVVIVRMPFNLAVFGANAAGDVIVAYPNVSNWAIGGHSLGGSMAAQYAHDNQDKIEGLVLLASYPASNTDLSKQNLSVVTIHGSNDGLVSDKQIVDSLKQLPSNTVRVEIAGGNHAQFGWYGAQSGDNEATISREQQQNQTVTAIVNLLVNIKQIS